MLDISETYFGFTDNDNAMVAGRKQKILDKIYHYDDGLMRLKQIIFNRLLDGGEPRKEEDEPHYNRLTGELTKPKTVYYIEYNDKGRRYVQINKTGFDFASYLIKNGFNDGETALDYMNKEKERLDRERKEKR